MLWRSIMKNKSLKATQKLLVLTSQNLRVHPGAKSAFMVWQQHRLPLLRPQLASLDDYYRQPLRLCAVEDSYQFFNTFARIDEVMKLETRYRQPCLIAPESSHDIKRLAWCEVLSLSRFNGVDHPMLFKAIYQNSPKQLICELMGVNRLTVASYCQFAGINQSAYEYQQCKVANDEAMLGLPKNLNWMDTSYGSH